MQCSYTPPRWEPYVGLKILLHLVYGNGLKTRTKVTFTFFVIIAILILLVESSHGNKPVSMAILATYF